MSDRNLNSTKLKYVESKYRNYEKMETTNTLRKKCPYSELFCSVFSCILIECEIFNPNAGKWGAE